MVYGRNNMKAVDSAVSEKHGIEVPFPQRDVHLKSFFGAKGDEARSLFAKTRQDEPKS